MVVLVLALLGILPFFKSPGSNGPSFANTRGPAQSTANGHPGGPWTMIFGGGIALNATTNISKLNTTFNGLAPNCTISRASGSSPTTLQGVGNVSQGFASTWAFVFRNASGGVLAVSDFAGSYQVQGTAAGAGCSSFFGGLLPIPAGVVDSTTAAKSADGAGGYAFLKAHPSANGSIAILNGLSFAGFTLGSEWLISYSACPFVNSGQLSDPLFYALVNATTGTVVQTLLTTMSCPVTVMGTKIPIGTALAMVTPSEASAGGHYWYNFTVQMAGGGLTWGNTAFQVKTSTGSIVPMPSTATLGIVSITGTVVASYSFASGTWLTGGPLTVSNTQELSIETPASTPLSGYSLQVIGTGSFSGTLLISIP